MSAATEKKKRIRLTAVMLIVLAAAFALGGLGLYMLRGLSAVSEPMPYDSNRMTYQTADLTSLVTAEGFARDLCVGEKDKALEGFELSGSACGALYAVSEGKLLFARGMYDTIYPASITKLMTALLAFENGNMDDIVVINWEDLELESGSQVTGLQIGDQVRLGDLVTAMLVHSGNDAAQAIARHIGGSQQAFVKMMNERSKELGATGTHYVNASGLHDPSHYTTVYDIYLTLSEISKYEAFINTSQIRVYQLNYTGADGQPKSVTLDSTDRYVTGEVRPPKNVTILGGKTGTTAMAGSCLALLTQNAYGELFISIIVRSPDKASLYSDMNACLSYIHL